MAGLDHLTVGATDFAAALGFYDAVLPALGWARVHELRDEEEDDTPVEAAAWSAEPGSAVDTSGGTAAAHHAATVWLVTSTTTTRGLHLALRADSRTEVETFYAEALSHGGFEHTSPRPWTLYRRGEYHAIARDPAGNLVEAVCADPGPG